jgi:hypothetical protein
MRGRWAAEIASSPSTQVRTRQPADRRNQPDSTAFLAFSQPAIPSGITYTFV